LAAFLIIEVTEVHDERTYAQYRGRVPSTLAAEGGATWFAAGEWKCLKEAGNRSESWSYASILLRRRVAGGMIRGIRN